MRKNFLFYYSIDHIHDFAYFLSLPAVSTDGEVEFIRSKSDGVFLPLIEHNHYVKKGDLIGEVVDPFEGTVKQQIRTAKGGLLFTLRAYPVVYEGDLLARILTE